MEIQNALLKSQAYQSLSIESEIFSIMKKYFRDAERSPYFLDNLTNKIREVDIVASARFQKNKKNSTFCNINFFIECKTNKGFNIIVDGVQSKQSPHLYDWVVWAGDDTNERLEKSRAILLKTNLDSDTINQELKNISNIFYPNDYKLTGSVQLEAFPNIDSFSSFRETNIKDEKDLDNSVLWRAFQSLSSAHTSFKHAAWKYYEEALLDYADSKTNPHKDYDFDLKISLNFSSRYMDLIHKIIVIDSPLWKRINDEKIESIKYFRLVRKRIDSINVDFVDVVNRQYFSDYIEAMNQYYIKFQKSKRLERIW